MTTLVLGLTVLIGSFVVTITGLAISNRGFVLRPKMYSNMYELTPSEVAGALEDKAATQPTD
jgi:hypothetical protein